MKIDLNSDVGELPERIADGTQDEVMRLVTSVNVSCGAHAGDEATLLATLESAKRLGLAVGAHPSYPDRAGFGRTRMAIPPIELSRQIRTQLSYLAELASKAGVTLSHVKPHGALYNVAAVDEAIADAVATAVKRFDSSLLLVGLASSPGLEIFRSSGLRVAGEAFIDRRYDDQAHLRPRKLADALITDTAEALEQARSIVRDGRVRAHDGSWVSIQAQTLCIHSDTPGAQHLARTVREGLESDGIRIESLSPARDPISSS
jgi:UPF0271 protein